MAKVGVGAPEYPRLRVALVGAGEMGRNWVDAIGASDDVELAAVVDLDLAHAQAAVATMRGVVATTDLTTATETTTIDMIVNATVPAAHHAVNTEALYLGLPVLCEKPITPTVEQALSLAAASEHTGQLLATSQSSRHGRDVAAFRTLIGGLGDIGTLTTEFFLAPHFGGFRKQMDHVLLVDMAIHSFDLARYLLDDNPLAVYCRESNPDWSWYLGGAAATAIFEMRSGASYTYVGSWCAEGFPTSWGGRWRANGANGTAIWDGQAEPRAEYGAATAAPGRAVNGEAEVPGIAGALRDFTRSLRSGRVPSSEVHANVWSLAMVEAAVRSSVTGARVVIDDVLREARDSAIRHEARPELVPLIAQLQLTDAN